MLSGKILTTLAYYDVLDYPMTSFEIWKYLTKDQCALDNSEEKTKLVEILKELEKEDLKKSIEEYQGYYFLKGRKSLVEQRIERNKISEVKFKRIRKAVWFLRFLPFVRMIAVTGRLAMKNAEKGSDLDLLIALKQGHIFTGRFLVTGVIHLLGMRRYNRKVANRICLNFFITDGSLEINLKDLFSSSEYYFMRPLFGYETFRKFQKENAWIRNFRENFFPEEVGNLKIMEDSTGAGLFRKFGESVLSFRLVEDWMKKWQVRRIMKDPRTHMNGSMVMADSDALIFLPEPQGPVIFERFQEKLDTLDL